MFKHKLLVFLFFCSTTLSANKLTDSLISLIQTTSEDTMKVSALNSLFLEYEYDDPKKAEECLTKALELGQNIKDRKWLAKTYRYLGFMAEDKGNIQEAIRHHKASLKIYEALGSKSGISSSCNNIGNILIDEGNFSEALKYHTTSLKISQELQDIEGVAKSYNNLGIIFRLLGNYPEALKNYLISLKLKEAIGNTKDIAGAYNNIGILYNDQNNYDEAIKNGLISLKLAQSIGYKHGMSDAYNNLGSAYLNMGNYTEAMRNHKASLKIAQELENKMSCAGSYNNLGNVYGMEKNYEGALNSHFSALKIYEEIGDTIGIASSYVNIGNDFLLLKKHKKAREYLQKARLVAEKVGLKQYLRESYGLLSKIDSAGGNYKGAYENNKMYHLYRDSIDSDETRKKIIQSRMTFDFEKKEAVAEAEHKKELQNQDLLAEEKSRKQNIVLFFTLGSLFLVLIFAGFIFRSLRLTRKQKAVIQEQKHLVEEKQKEIIDSINYAKRIQQSHLPTLKYIHKTLQRLQKKAEI